MANSIGSMTLGDGQGPYFIVGTAYIEPQELEPSKVTEKISSFSLAMCALLHRGNYSYLNRMQGRILVLQSRDGKLHVICTKETRGAVYNVTSFQGKLLAGINGRIQLYRYGFYSLHTRAYINNANNE
jgi:DNA damage-binding protein 1